MSKIKNCPFCNGKCEVRQMFPRQTVSERGILWHKISCLNRGCPSDESLTVSSDTKENTIKKWNTRAIEDKLVEALKYILNLFDRGLPESSIGRKRCDEAKQVLREIDE